MHGMCTPDISEFIIQLAEVCAHMWCGLNELSIVKYSTTYLRTVLAKTILLAQNTSLLRQTYIGIIISWDGYKYPTYIISHIFHLSLHCFAKDLTSSERFKSTFVLMVFVFFFVMLLAQQRPRILEHPADAVAAREEPLTLNCKAAGRPPPEISWYHNGTPLVPSERRVILPEGSLFFLR